MKRFIPKQNCEVWVRTIVCTTFEEASRTLSEVSKQMRIHHQSICEILEVEMFEEDPPYRLEVQSELLRSSLSVVRARQPSAYWSETELLKFASDLISALAECQRQEIAHRNLILSAILFSTSNTVKVANFEHSKWEGRYSRMQSVQLVSPFAQTRVGFFSPLVRAAMLECASQAEHDAVKSDVYSLGVCLLCLALLRLDPPTDRAQLEAAISQVAYPQLKALIETMTTEDEGARPDFVNIHLSSTVQVLPPRKLCSCCGGELDSEDWKRELPAKYQACGYFLQATCSRRCLDQRLAEFWNEKKECLIESRHSFVLDRAWVEEAQVQSSPYKMASKKICSHQCWLKLTERLSTGRVKLCQHCWRAVLSLDSSVVLPCQHSFCDIRCFVSFLSELSTEFTVKRPVVCGIDGVRVEDRKVFEELRARWKGEPCGVYKQYCVKCLKEEQLNQLDCQRHYCCSSCTQGPRCPICPSA